MGNMPSLIMFRRLFPSLTITTLTSDPENKLHAACVLILINTLNCLLSHVHKIISILAHYDLDL